MKLFGAAALALTAMSGAAFAQAASVTTGATVYGPQGEPVGTIAQVAGGNAVVNTGTHSVTLPLDKFATGAKGPTITVNKATLDQLAAQAEAQATAGLDAALVTGAAVVDSNKAPLGTIDKVDGDNVVVKTDKGSVSLTRKFFTVQNGTLMAGVTAAQVAATISGAASS